MCIGQPTQIFFPDAHNRITKAIQFLKTKKGVDTIYLMGHSMGSRMVSAYYPEDNDKSIKGLILAGCRNNGDYPLSCKENIQGTKLPVLDIWGESDAKDSISAYERQSLKSKTYTQIEIPGADHKFDGYDYELTSTVINWLKTM